MKTVLVVGGVSFDTLVYMESFPPAEPGTVFARGMRETVGSTGAAKALNLHRLGLETTLHTLVGDDPPGEAVRALFAREGLRCAFDIDPAGTERHVNLMRTDGARLSIYAQPGSFDPPIDLVALEQLTESANLVALNINNYCRRLIPAIRRLGRPLWCDLHDYDGQSAYHQDFVDAADVLFLSDERLPDYRAFMRRMIDAGKQFAVCTHGARGSTALSAAGEWIETPALAYPLVDSNGAGDSFFSGVLYGHVQGYGLARALRCGTVAGGLTVASPELYGLDLSPALLEAEYRRHYGDTPA